MIQHFLVVFERLNVGLKVKLIYKLKQQSLANRLDLAKLILDQIAKLVCIDGLADFFL